MRLDNKQISANILNSGDNIIMCSCLQEAFFDIYSVEIQGESFLKKADRIIDGCPIIKLNVEYQGIEYKDVEFKLAAADADEVFINETLLQHGFEYAAPEQSLCIEQQLCEIAQEPQYIEYTPETLEIMAAPDAGFFKEQARNSQEKRINKTLSNIYNKLNVHLSEQLLQAKTSMLQETLMSQMQMQNHSQQKLDESVNGLQQEFVDLSNQLQKVARNFTDAAVAKFKGTVVEQCNALLQETNATHLEHLQLQIKQNAVDAKDALQQNLKKSFKEKFQQLSAQHTDHHQQVQVFVEQQLQNMEQQIKLQQISTFEDSVAALMNDQSMFIDGVVNDKITFIQESLHSLSQQLQQTLLQQMQSAQSDAQQHLQQMSEQVHGKLATVDNVVTSAVADASQQLTQLVDNLNASRLATVEQQVEQILREQFSQAASADTVVEEASQSKAISNAINAFKSQLNKDLQTQAANLQTEMYRKFAIYADSMGGGGTVAVQYADGGTMRGSLNVSNGQILSGGVDISTLFSGGGGTASGAYLPLSGGTLTGNLNVIGGGISAIGPTLTGSQATNSLSVSANWNTTGNPVLIYGRVANIASGSTARLIDLGTDSTGSLISLSKTGQFQAGQTGQTGGDHTFVNALGSNQGFRVWSGSGTGGVRISYFGLLLGGGYNLGFGSDVTGIPDTIISREAPSILAQVNGSNAQTLRFYNTYTNTSNYERGFTRWSGSSFTATISGSLMTMTVAAVGTFAIGQRIAGTGVTSGTLINSLSTGTLGAINSTYVVSTSQTVSAATVMNSYSDVFQVGTEKLGTGSARALSLVTDGTERINIGVTGNITITSSLSTNQDMEITDATKGIILKSPNGTKYRVTVSNAGELTTTLI